MASFRSSAALCITQQLACCSVAGSAHPGRHGSGCEGAVAANCSERCSAALVDLASASSVVAGSAALAVACSAALARPVAVVASVGGVPAGSGSARDDLIRVERWGRQWLVLRHRGRAAMLSSHGDDLSCRIATRLGHGLGR